MGCLMVYPNNEFDTRLIKPTLGAVFPQNFFISQLSFSLFYLFSLCYALFLSLSPIHEEQQEHLRLVPGFRRLAITNLILRRATTLARPSPPHPPPSHLQITRNCSPPLFLRAVKHTRRFHSFVFKSLSGGFNSSNFDLACLKSSLKLDLWMSIR
ncbi:unnamed protein product [Trifolium pratense]|uniref:Uncharacterized protein n=1 Tax=Trifolium pratense TaxID=57577 RepID=A0ACB0KTF1_TRIPR|nr:unnamed protein product [Trifolium pratense]